MVLWFKNYVVIHLIDFLGSLCFPHVEMSNVYRLKSNAYQMSIVEWVDGKQCPECTTELYLVMPAVTAMSQARHLRTNQGPWTKILDFGPWANKFVSQSLEPKLLAAKWPHCPLFWSGFFRFFPLGWAEGSEIISCGEIPTRSICICPFKYLAVRQHFCLREDNPSVFVCLSPKPLPSDVLKKVLNCQGLTFLLYLLFCSNHLHMSSKL